MKTTSSLGNEQAIDILSSAIGEFVWFVRCVEDRILRLEFGNPHLIVREPQKVTASASEAMINALSRRVVVATGKWSLFIEDGLWVIETKKNRSCGRFDLDKEKTDKCLSQLDGQKLLAVEHNSETGDWIFKFDLSGILTIKYHRDIDSNSQWTMFFEGGGHLSYVGPGNIILEQ